MVQILSDDKCKTILKEPSGNYKIIRYNLQYDGCSLVGILDKNLLFKSVYKIFFKRDGDDFGCNFNYFNCIIHNCG